jgi:exonuclease VII large subunit
MSAPANVQSVAAIEKVRLALLRFGDAVEQSTMVLENEIQRVMDWIEHDRPRHWRMQIHQAQEELAQSQAALHRCLMFPIADERPSCHEERDQVKRAQARLAYCQEKTERLKHWVREVRKEQFTFEGRISHLRQMVEVDVPQAVSLLAKLIRRLEEYQAIGSGTAGPGGTARLIEELLEPPEETPPST